MFTARNRQNAFAKRRRAQAVAEAAVPAPESSPEPPAPKPVQMAAPFDGNQSPDHIETPDIATVNQEIEAQMSTEQFKAVPVLSPDLQAKIDAIANRATPPAVEPEPTSESETDAILADPDAMAAIAEAEAEQPAPEPKRGRGRPRPAETIVRDGKVYDLLNAADPNEGVSKEALAISLGEKEQQVYSSLRQLTKEGRAETRYVKGHGYRWFAA